MYRYVFAFLPKLKTKQSIGYLFNKSNKIILVQIRLWNFFRVYYFVTVIIYKYKQMQEILKEISVISVAQTNCVLSNVCNFVFISVHLQGYQKFTKEVEIH